MWYWLLKLQKMLLLPLYVVYYALRGIPFTFRCRKCGIWLFDEHYLRLGMCKNCYGEMIRSDSIGYYMEHDEYLEGRFERMVYPSRTASDLLYRRIVRRVGEGRVLDVGCGYGYILSGLQAQHSDLYGIDVKKRLMEEVKHWIKGGNFCLGDAINIPFQSNTFDYLICTEVLEHIEGNGAVKECYRVLKPGGVALITVPNGKKHSGNPEHVRLFTFESVSNLLEETGFEIISGEKFGLYIPFINPFIELLLRISGRRLPLTSPFDIEVPEFLAGNFFIECRKAATREGR
jgi:SAM-dependent methyltransferase